MHPTDIGHAAAYEAYRTWIHNRSIYEPLSGDTHRQREGLIGLAVAEGTFDTVILMLYVYSLHGLLYISLSINAIRWPRIRS